MLVSVGVLNTVSGIPNQNNTLCTHILLLLHIGNNNFKHLLTPTEVIKKYDFSFCCSNPRVCGRCWIAEELVDFCQRLQDEALTAVGRPCDHYIAVFAATFC